MKPMTNDRAGTIAAEALRFLATDEERISRFLALTGVDPASLRERLHDDAFLAGILAHVLENEALLVEFADQAGLRPDDPANAYVTLSGEQNG